MNKVFDSLSISSWDPMVLWRGIHETLDEKIKYENLIVKAIDCLNWFEVGSAVSVYLGL